MDLFSTITPLYVTISVAVLLFKNARLISLIKIRFLYLGVLLSKINLSLSLSVYAPNFNLWNKNDCKSLL